jgi:hypothetical protein
VFVPTLLAYRFTLPALVLLALGLAPRLLLQ